MFDQSPIWNDNLGKAVTIAAALCAWSVFYTQKAPLFTIKRLAKENVLVNEDNLED